MIKIKRKQGRPDYLFGEVKIGVPFYRVDRGPQNMYVKVSEGTTKRGAHFNSVLLGTGDLVLHDHSASVRIVAAELFWEELPND